MYAKVFQTLLDSTVNELDIAVRYVWVCLLLLAEPPDGFIDMTPAAIARRINVPEPTVLMAIDQLSQPDGMSRSPEEDGRRLVKIRESYGWQIVNFAKYREMERAEHRREYMRGYMVDYRKQGVNSRKQPLSVLADTEAKAKAKEGDVRFAPGSPPLSLAEELVTLNRQRDPKFKAPNLQAEAREFDSLIRRDEREISEIQRVMRFAKSHDYWSSKTTTAKGLRKHYAQIIQQMPAPAARKGGLVL
jgi:hypothetical protein